MAVIGAARSVLPDRSSELRHRQDHNISHAAAKVFVQCRDGLTEVLKPIRQLSARRTLIRVSVPAANVGEGHFNADVRFDELRNLQQRLTKRRTRIVRAVCCRVLLRVRLFQHLDGFKSLFARSVKGVWHAMRIKLFKSLSNLTVSLARANAEVRDIGHGNGGRWTQQRPGQIRRKGNGAERRRPGVFLGLHVAVQPAVSSAFVTRRARLHIILSVEVRARIIRRSHGVNDREMAFVVNRFERCERGVKSEKAVEIYSSIRIALLRLRHCNLRTHAVIAPVPERNHGRDSIHCAALKDRDDDRVILTRNAARLSQGDAL